MVGHLYNVDKLPGHRAGLFSAILKNQRNPRNDLEITQPMAEHDGSGRQANLLVDD